MKCSSLLIVTYGRTGSTLLMGILNSIPGVLVRGENMNLCAGLFSAYEALQTTKTQHGKAAFDSTHPFHGADRLDEEAFLKDAQLLLRRQLVPVDRDDVECWGFKEIRYIPESGNNDRQYNLSKYLDFLADMLPNPAFIFLTRNHEHVVDSTFWKKGEKSTAIARISLFEKQARQWSCERKDCFWIDYSQMLSGPMALQELFDFLGAPFDWGIVQQVMTVEHSCAGKPENLKHVIWRK